MLSRDEYLELKELVQNAILQSKPSSEITCKFDRDCVQSFYGQMLVRHAKSTARAIESRANQICECVNRGQSLFALSREFSCSSYKIAKVYVEVALKPLQISNIIEDPTLVADVALREDILKCVASDPSTSHEISLTQECVGREYEDILISMLSELNLCFETESDLRSRGKPRTPDILFFIPMATQLRHRRGRGEEGGELVVVNWIDSKAMFADEVTFQEHEEQFKGYVNRYGRGLVIYWHGFVESVLSLVDDMVTVTDSFPDVWVYPTGETAKPGSIGSLVFDS